MDRRLYEKDCGAERKYDISNKRRQRVVRLPPITQGASGGRLMTARTVLTLFERRDYAISDLVAEIEPTALQALEALLDAPRPPGQPEIIHLGRRTWSTSQYVGIWKLGSTTLQILPKVDRDTPLGSPVYGATAASAATNLVRMLAIAEGTHLHSLDAATLAHGQGDWLEVFTTFWARHLQQQLRRGPERHYVDHEDTLSFLRGRLLLAQQLRKSAARAHLFDVNYVELTANTPLNRILRTAVQRLSVGARSSRNRALLADLDGQLSEAPVIHAVEPGTFAQVHFNRLNEHLKPAFQLARLILEACTPILRSGENASLAFVVNMDHLFEAFIAAVLRRHLPALLPPTLDEIRLVTQSSGSSVHLLETEEIGAPVLKLKPDLELVTAGGQRWLIADTKYKRLNTSRTDLGLHQEDVYQILAYAARHRCSRLLLLFPRSADEPEVLQVFRQPQTATRLVVATVDLGKPLDRLDSVTNALRQAIALAGEVELTHDRS